MAFAVDIKITCAPIFYAIYFKRLFDGGGQFFFLTPVFGLYPSGHKNALPAAKAAQLVSTRRNVAKNATPNNNYFLARRKIKRGEVRI
jgi:hypothetical protein